MPLLSRQNRSTILNFHRDFAPVAHLCATLLYHRARNSSSLLFLIIDSGETCVYITRRESEFGAEIDVTKGCFMTVREFNCIIDAYFDECAQSSVFPDEAGMMLRLGIDHDNLEEMLQNAGKRHSKYRKAIINARLRRESLLTREIFAAESRSPTGKIFLSRQNAGGGLTDKSVPQPSAKEHVQFAIDRNDKSFE